MQFNDIKVISTPPVGTIQMCREDIENALVPEGSEREMYSALEMFRTDPGIHAVVLTGSGKVFSRGGQRHPVDPRPEPPALSLGQRLAYGYSYGRFWDYFPEYKKPVIAAVNGYCADGAWDLVMLCDLVVAAESAVFHMNHVDMGIFPCHTTSHILMQMVGKHRAMDIIYNGRQLSAQDCLSLGLVNRVVADDQIADAAGEMAAEIAARPPLTISMTKQVLVNGMRLREMHAYELAVAHFLRTTDDTVAASKAWANDGSIPNFVNR